MTIDQNARSIERRKHQHDKLHKILSRHQSLHAKKQKRSRRDKGYQRYNKQHSHELTDHSFYDRQPHDVQIQIPGSLFQESEKRVIQG